MAKYRVTGVISGTEISEDIIFDDSISPKKLKEACEEAQSVMLDYWAMKFSFDFRKNLTSISTIKVEEVAQ